MLSVERVPQALAFSSRNQAGPGAVDGAFAESRSSFRCSLDGSFQSDMMSSWPSASQQASPSPEGPDQVAPETPSVATPQGDVTGFFPESYDPLALPGWNLGDDDTWSSLLGDLGGPVLGGDPLGPGYMDLGPETPSPELAAPSAGGSWGEESLLPPLHSAVSESFRPGSSGAKAELASSGVVEAPGGVSRSGPALADHVRQLILKGSGYSSASQGEKASLAERPAFPMSLSRSSQGSTRSLVTEPPVLVQGPQGDGPTLLPLQEPDKGLGGEKTAGGKVEEWSISELKGMLGLDEEDGEMGDALAGLPETPLAEPLRPEEKVLMGKLYPSRSGSGSGSGFGSHGRSGSPPGSSHSGSLSRRGGVSREGSESRERAPLPREGSGCLTASSFRSGSHRSFHSVRSGRSGEGHLTGTKRGTSESGTSGEGEVGEDGELDLGMDIDGPSGSDSMVGAQGSTDVSGSVSCDGCSSRQAQSPSSLGHGSSAGEEGEGEGEEPLPLLVEEKKMLPEVPEVARATATGPSQWHNKAAMLLLHRNSTSCDGSSPGSSGQSCRCGRCHGEATAFGARPLGQAEAAALGAGSLGQEGGAQQPAVLSSQRQQGSKEQAQDDRATASKPQALPAQAVDERSRPGDLSGRLAAVLGQLSGTPGAMEEPYALGMGASEGREQVEKGTRMQTDKQEPEAMRLPGGDSLLQVSGAQPKGLRRATSTATSSPPSTSRRSPAAVPTLEGEARQAGAGAMSAAFCGAKVEKKAGGGAAGGLKRDARRKKGKFTAEAPDGGSAGALAPVAGGGALVVAPGRGSPVSSYFRTCDVDVSWHVTPGRLPSPTLPALTASGEPGPGFNLGRGPRDLVFPPFNLGATLNLGTQAHRAGTLRGGPRGGAMGPGLLPGLQGEGMGESGWGGPDLKRPLRDQLMMLAEAYAVDDTAKVRALTRKLEKKADRLGTPDQRLALYFLQALEARADGTASAKYTAPITIPAQDLNASMQELCKRIPFLQTAQLANHEAILAATAGSDSVHILALGLWHGDNWGELFARMARRPGGPPAKIRISGVEAPCTPGKLAIQVSTANAVLQVKAAAAQAGLRVQVEFLQTSVEKLKASSVVVHPGETLVAFCAMRLQHLPDGSVVRANPRDSVLQAIFDLKPKCFVLIDMDVNFNSPFFLSRFKEALGYFGTVFESVDSCTERACTKRQIFEEAYFARDILNVVACEGLQRMSRSERIEQWGDRLRRIGFSATPFPAPVADKLRMLYACRFSDAVSHRGSGYTSAGVPPLTEEQQFRVMEVPDGFEVGWGRGRLLFGSCWATAAPAPA